MATPVTKYQDEQGNEFNTAAEADASTMRLKHRAAVDAFVLKHFPTKPGSPRGNPHAGTAAKAIYLWLAEHPSGV